MTKKIDMTTGNITNKLLLFTLPIFLGNIFQQIYSLSDTLVVGRFLGSNALAAVGSSTALMVLITSIIIGLCLGSSVLFAKLYAAKDYEKLSKAISTSIIFILGVTIIISAILLIFLEPLLIMFQVPIEALGLAKDYLYIVISGLFFLSLYNIAAAMLRAIGNSKIPLMFLIVSSTVNVAFDFILVLAIPMGIKGPALSTFFAQLASGIPIFIYALRQFKFVNLKLKFDKSIFKEVWDHSILTSLQQSIMNFGILLIQGLVNSFGVVAMAAFTIGVRIDAFAYMPAQDFGNAFSLYVAQNKGVNNDIRIRKGFRSAIVSSTIFCGIISIIIFIFAPFFVKLFSPENAEVLTQGVKYLRIEGSFYILIGYLFIFYALFRGLGMFKTSIVLTITSLGLRVLLAYSFTFSGLGLTSIWASIPIGWCIADLLGFYLYFKVSKKNFNLDLKSISKI